MCIIIVKPRKASIPEENLRESWRCNSDGGGYMTSDGSGLLIRKGFTDYDSFWESYQSDVTENSPAVVHFRIRTHGDLSKMNMHPHLMSNGIAVAHNGIISGMGINVGRADGSASDTKQFVNKYLNIFPKTYYLNPDFLTMVGSAVGRSNKLAFMFPNGTIRIVSKPAGTEVEKIWYSNSSWKPIVTHVRKPYPNTSTCWSGNSGTNNQCIVCKRWRYNEGYEDLCAECWKRIIGENQCSVCGEWTPNITGEDMPTCYSCERATAEISSLSVL